MFYKCKILTKMYFKISNLDFHLSIISIAAAKFPYKEIIWVLQLLNLKFGFIA